MNNHPVNVKRRYDPQDYGNTRIPSVSMKLVEIRQEEAHLPNMAVHAHLYCYAKLNDALKLKVVKTSYNLHCEQGLNTV